MKKRLGITAASVQRVSDAPVAAGVVKEIASHRVRRAGDVTDRSQRTEKAPSRRLAGSSHETLRSTLTGKERTLSPGGQNPLIEAFIEQFCTRFVPGGVVLHFGDAENKFQHFESEYFARVGVQIDSAAKMPDVVVHDPMRGWLVIGEAVTSGGVVDGNRRRELKELFAGFRCGLVFVTAFDDRATLARFLGQVSWETDVWVASDPDHVIHFNGERFLGPYPDTMTDG